MTSAADILRAARDKIAEPNHWTKGEYARDKNGNSVDAQAPDAVCWCARGAFYAVRPHGDNMHALVHLREAIHERAGHGGIVRLNDGSDHADVLAVFDRAIQLAEAR